MKAILTLKQKQIARWSMFLMSLSFFVVSCTKETTTSLGTFTYTTSSATFISGGTAGASVAPTYVGTGSAGTYSTASTLPTGVTLNATTGVISWTGAITAGTYTISVKNSNASTEATYTLTVTAASSNPSFSYSTASATFVSGGTAASSVAPTFVNGTAGAYSTVSTLPTGVTLNATTGVISWTGTVVAGTYNIIVKNANATATQTYSLTVTAAAAVTTYAVFPVDFEGTPEITLKNDLGGVGTIVDNPKKTTNTSNKVLKLVKGAGAKWANVQFVMKDPIDFSTKKSIKVDVYSPRVGAKFLLKVENATDNNINKETEVATTKANEWETLEFNFSSIDVTKSYSRFVLIFDILSDGDGSANYTFHLDNFTQVTSTVNLTPATLPMTFEAANTDYAGWTGFDGGVYALADNPSKTGINTSAKVAKYTKTGVTTWAGMSYTLSAAIDFTTNKAFKMKVYSPTAGKKVLLKIENGTANKEVEKTITAANTWEELEFYFAPTASNYNKLTVIFDNGNPGNDAVYYFDDITPVVGTAPAAAAAPTTAAPTPTTAASDVISLFSDAYTPGITEINFNPGWGNITNSYSEETIANNKVIKYANLTFHGTQFKEVNLSTKATLHVDYWTPDMTSFQITPIGGGETLVTVTVANKNQWGSIDIPLTSFTAVDFSKVIQMKVVGSGTLYLDNIYFHGTGTPVVIPVPTTAPTAPTVASSSVLSLYSEAASYGNLGNTNPNWGETVTEETIATNKVKKTPNFLPFDLGAIQNLTSKTKLHFDVWVSNKPAAGSGILIKLAKGNWPAANDEGHATFPWSSITAGQWVSVDVNLSSFVQVSGTFSLSSINQVILDPVDDLGGGNAAYFDNVYFY